MRMIGHVLILLSFLDYVFCCGDTFSLDDLNPSESFTSENYPGYYPKDSWCSWKVNVDTVREVYVMCTVFDVQSSRGCRRAALSFSTSEDDYEEVCTGTSLFKVFNTNSLEIEFVSRTKLENNDFKGFTCTVALAVSSSGSGKCVGGVGDSGDSSSGKSSSSVNAEESSGSETSSGKPCKCGLKKTSRIVGGVATTPNEYPWQALIKLNGQGACGGSLISKQWVLTAAHCLEFKLSAYSIVLGEHDKSTSDDISQEFGVSQIVSHEDYNPSTYDNDIGLMEMSLPVAFSEVISPVCLPFTLGPVPAGNTLTVTGWGTTSSGGSTSSYLLEVDVKYIPNPECRSSTYGYGSKITENMFCAGVKEGGKDACQGDSGGPIIYKREDNINFLMGAVSWGYFCANKNYPGVYTRVENYIDWIEENTGAAEHFCIA